MQGKESFVVRHPMAMEQTWPSRLFNDLLVTHDLAANHCTIEEREEYETHLEMGTVVYAGLIMGKYWNRPKQRRRCWFGMAATTYAFYHPDLWITLTDPCARATS